MPSLLRRRTCPVCGRSHNFCLAGGDIASGQEFDFLCPQTDRSGLLKADAAGEETQSYVQGAVALTRAATRRPVTV